MPNIAKSLEDVNTLIDEMVPKPEAVTKTMTPAEFLGYAKQQIEKSLEDADHAPRLSHLIEQIQKVMGFDDGDGGPVAIYTDGELSLSGQTSVDDMTSIQADCPPGVGAAATAPTMTTPPSSTQGYDDTSTGGVSTPVTTPGGDAMPMIAKSLTGWANNLASSEFLDQKPNNVDEHLDFGPDTTA